MHFGVIGINCKNSDLLLREEFAKACLLAQETVGFSPEVKLVLLPTCNRFEIYFEGHCLHEIQSGLIQWIRSHLCACFEQKLYTFFAEECLHHLACVASGLDSRIVGETEIRRQVKNAYAKAASQNKLGAGLHFLFQKAFQISKKIRSNYPNLSCYQTLEETVCALTLATLKKKEALSVLFYGKSEINRKICQLLKKRMDLDMTLCSRFPLTEEERKNWDEKIHFVKESSDFCWHSFDCVIGAAERNELVLKKEVMITEINTSLMIDLSVPRIIDPSFKTHPGLTLLNIDEVLSLVDGEKKRFAKSLAKIQNEIWILAKRNLISYRKKLEFSMTGIAGERADIPDILETTC